MIKSKLNLDILIKIGRLFCSKNYSCIGRHAAFAWIDPGEFKLFKVARISLYVRHANVGAAYC